MTGLGVLLRKELLEAWRTLRLPVTAGLFLVIGLTSPLLARYLPEIIEAAAGDALPPIPIPTPTAVDAVEQLWKNLAQFGAIAAILISMGAVATERERGTAAFVLSKTASRAAFLAAKAVAIAGVLGLGIGLATAAGWIYTAILFEPLPIAGWLAMGVLAWLALCAWAAITFAASAVVGSASGAAGIGIVAFLALSIVAAIPGVERWTPAGLAAPAMALATGAPVATGDLLVPVVACVLIIVAALGVARASFRRQEL